MKADLILSTYTGDLLKEAYEEAGFSTFYNVAPDRFIPIKVPRNDIVGNMCHSKDSPTTIHSPHIV